MAEDTLKDLTINWILGGFLIFCLLSFAISFMFNNNPTGLNDGTETILEQTSDGYSDLLVETTEDSNAILNITANTNPEVSDLGSRDSVAVSFSTKKSATSFWTQSRLLISWVFSGTVGNILIGVLGGLMSFIGMFALWRFIRTGV